MNFTFASLFFTVVEIR